MESAAVPRIIVVTVVESFNNPADPVRSTLQENRNSEVRKPVSFV
jgi:hypothetical protein